MIADFFSLYGDVNQLKFPEMENNLDQLLKPFSGDWKQYNPKKPNIKRQGLSITSLDGKLSGYPDLDSVKEYNEINHCHLDECSFDKVTAVGQAIPSVSYLIKKFESVGRSHFIKFGAGGFFPYHRDGNFRLPAKSFRIFSIAVGDGKSDFVWLQEGRQLNLETRKWYVINTFKEHAVFSFKDDVIITVLNVPVSEKAIEVLIDHLHIS